MTQLSRAGCAAAIPVLAFAMGGCAGTGVGYNGDYKAGPAYTTPSASVAESWLDADDAAIDQAQGLSDDPAWWKCFNDPVLNRLIADALGSNLSLEEAGYRVLEARALRQVAAGLLYPQSQQILGEFSYNRVSRNTYPVPAWGPLAGDLAVDDYEEWQIGVGASWELDVWGRFRRQVEAAGARIRVSEADRNDVLVCLAADTASAYVEMRALQIRISMAHTNVLAQRESSKIAEARFENGVAGELDVTQARANLARTVSRIPQLSARLREANNRLCLLLGRPPRDLSKALGRGTIPDPPREIAVGVPAELLRRRPDVRRAESEVARQSALIGVSAANLLPRFSISGAIAWEAEEPDDLFRSSSDAGYVGPSVAWDVLDYGRNRNRLRAQEARLEQVMTRYRLVVLSANAEAGTAIHTYLSARREARALRVGVAATQRSVDLVLAQYREGAVSFNRVFNLQTLLASQQDNLTIAEAKVALGLIRVYKALGGGWIVEPGKVDQ